MVQVNVNSEELAGEEALVATADFLYQVLRAEVRLKRFFVSDNLVDLAKGLRQFLSAAFSAGEWPKIQMSTNLLSDDVLSGLVEVLLTQMKKPLPLGEDALVKAVGMLGTTLKSDARVQKVFSQIEAAAIQEEAAAEAEALPIPGAGTGLLEDESLVDLDLGDEEEDEEDEAEEEEAEPVYQSSSDANEVNTKSFDAIQFPDDQAEQVQVCWKGFLDCYQTRELAGEALYAALFDSAPSLQSLFKTPRAVMALRFLNGIHQIIMALHEPKNCKQLVEALGFQHLDLEVTVPRVVIFRDAIMDLIVTEMGEKLTPKAADGIKKTLNYAGGSYIFIRETFSERLKILAQSWRIASGQQADEMAQAEAELKEEQGSEELEEEEGSDAGGEGSGEKNEGRFSGEHEDFGGGGGDDVMAGRPRKKDKRSLWDRLMGRKANSAGDMTASFESADGSGKKARMLNQQGVPTTFDEMFQFNAAVMGLSHNVWMYEVLASFDAIVKNIANSYRVQEECDVLALRMSKLKGAVKLAEYKAVMLASLRSLVPDWSSAHEVAWNWLWENVERMLEQQLGKPIARERALGRFMGSLEEDTKQHLQQDVYTKFFALAPGGQEYFKQSATRLYFIADKVFEMTLEMYKEPKNMVDLISALGLRHVGYGIPTEFFSPFVTGCIQVVKELMEDEILTDAFGWSLGLISRVLVRTINEGSTIVMKAINMNSVKQVKKALSCAPRGKRATWMLNITVGTQSISPLIWSITSGSLEAATVIIKDLLTIRADRERYYYGVDELFERHPDIVEIITGDAPGLLPTMLEGMLWRSRIAVNGQRRVNYYLKHLLVDAEGHFADALEWVSKMGDPSIVTHSLLANLTDIVWSSIIYRTFLLSKIWLLFTLVVFLFSQSILKTIDGGQSMAVRYSTFACRTFVYLCSMFELIYSRTKYACKAWKEGDTVQVANLPVPRRYVEDWHEVTCVMLTLMLIAMFFQEPIMYCLQSEEHGRFSQMCSQADAVREPYTILSMLTMILYFALLIDFTALSTRLSAFVLVMGQVLPELGLTLLACAYSILMFGSSITTTDETSADFAGIHKAALSLFEIMISMYAGNQFEALEQHGWTIAAVICFVITITVFLFNLLIAQLNCAYLSIYSSMVGYARLSRIEIICSTIPSIPSSRFGAFIENLRLEEKLEFGEGDIGLAGGIQVLELASAHPTNVDGIRRFGGSTSMAMPWPEEDDDLGNSEAERFERLEKSLQKAMKKLGSANLGGGARKTTKGDMSSITDSEGQSSADSE
eukprot:TRINITY_DN4882_c0_g1_i2.p1 TRINITY_DN4882_c0_g1~~TRINITY_DN4882_c0_g1_i2.p1  ORF type:complete len:1278 (+),score=337.48 TRINITY_DN4882_c0_g1_i2:114-3947(+)